MKVLHVSVVNKIATYQKRDGNIVCGNSDYQVKFTFDSEWSAHNQKTARFIWAGQFIDVPFTGDTCNVPIIQNTDEVKIGVYAGNLQTTTSAVIGCVRSILCEGAAPSVENDQYYANRARESADRAEAAAGNAAASAATAASEAAEAATAAAEAEVTRLVGELGVVQELGTSPTSVVSQAVTTALYNRNAKRITNIEQGVAEQFETDASVAYVKDVPANALPYAEIKKIGGMTYKDGNTLRSAKVTEVKSVGVNLWGWGDVISTQYAYSMDRLLGIIEPNKQYTLTWKYSSNGTKDTQNQIIVYTENGSVGIVNGHPFTISEAQLSTVQGVYMYFGSDMTIGSMTGIMLNKGSTAQPYTPYVKHTLPIPTAAQALDGYGLGVNENCYNYIAWNPEDNIKTWNKRVGIVDLGTLDWQYVTSGNTRFDSYSLIEVLKKISSTSVSNIICTKYEEVGTANQVYSGLAQIATTDGVIWICDSNYTDAATFKAAMSGVMLVYELAEPEVTDISDLITADNLIGVEGGGTLTFENEYGYAVPSEVEYQVEV